MIVSSADVVVYLSELFLRGRPETAVDDSASDNATSREAAGQVPETRHLKRVVKIK
jgi:hypothetical protein